MASGSSDPAQGPGIARQEPSGSTFHAADRIAVLAGTVVTVFGLGELFLPLLLQPFTGLEAGNAATIIGLLWTALGLMLLLGGGARLRAITISAAEFLLIVSACGLAVMLWKAAGVLPVFVHGAIAGLCFVSGGLVRLTDRSDLKKEITKARELARRDTEKVEGRDAVE